MSANGSETKGHVAALDGLRAIAILLVLARHSVGFIVWPRTGGAAVVERLMLAGWIGVDIFPPYYLFLAVVFAVRRDPAPHGTWWYWSYLTNELFARHGFGPEPHLWSLAVEEQFYLVWPAVIRLVPRRRIAAVALGVVVLSATWRAFVATHRPPPAAYVLTTCHLDEFAVGGLVALHLRAREITVAFLRGARVALCVAALVTIARIGVLSFPAISRGLETGVPLATIATAATIALTLRRDRGGTLSHLLGLAPLRSIGRYSYAIYLVHLDIGTWVSGWCAPLSVASPLADAAVQMIATLAGSWALGWVSWRLIERRCLALKRFVPMPVPGRHGRIGAQAAGQPAVE